MHEGAYRTEREADDIALPADSTAWRPGLDRFADMHSGDCLAMEETAYARFAKALDRLQPQVIQLEQPWLYPPLHRWLDERKVLRATPARLVYSSQNIEWKLKRDEMPPDTLDRAAYLDEIRRVETLESAVVRAADLVIACTDEELTELRAMADDGNAHRRFVVARNAIAPFSATSEQIDAVKRKYGLDRYPLFVGSAHPPNADGFWSMLAPSLAFLRPGERIVAAGGVGHILRQQLHGTALQQRPQCGQMQQAGAHRHLDACRQNQSCTLASQLLSLLQGGGVHFPVAHHPAWTGRMT